MAHALKYLKHRQTFYLYTALSHNEVDELFGDSDSEEEFHGFANE